MNDSQTYEQIIRQRSEGKYLWYKIGLVFIYIFLFNKLMIKEKK